MGGPDITMARGVHLMDFVRYLTGREPEFAGMRSDESWSDAGTEETVLATLQLDDGSFASLFATRHAVRAPNAFTIYGTKGLVQGIGTFGPSGGGTLQVARADSTAEISFQSKDPFREEVEAFNRAVQGGQSFAASGHDGLKVVRITEALLESARSGRFIPTT